MLGGHNSRVFCQIPIRGRLGIKCIDRESGDLSAFNPGNDLCAIDQTFPCRIYDINPFFHLLYGLFIYQGDTI